MKPGDTDVVVIGSGVSGQVAAHDLAVAGRSVIVVDRREFGGTCALRGCEPKKTLYAGAAAVERALQQEGHGPSGEKPLDWGALMAFKRTFTSTATAGIESYLRDAGAELMHGTARFTDPDTLDVDGRALRPGNSSSPPGPVRSRSASRARSS